MEVRINTNRQLPARKWVHCKSNNLDIDTRSDVYALGVLSYENGDILR